MSMSLGAASVTVQSSEPKKVDSHLSMVIRLSLWVVAGSGPAWRREGREGGDSSGLRAKTGLCVDIVEHQKTMLAQDRQGSGP